MMQRAKIAFNFQISKDLGHYKKETEQSYEVPQYFPQMTDLGEKFLFHFTKVMEKSQLTVSATKIPREHLVNISFVQCFFFRNQEKLHESTEVAVLLLSLCKIKSFFCS